MTSQEQRRLRDQNDYREMCNIRGPIVDWEVLHGTAPYVEAYRLTVNVRSIIGPGPDYRDRHVIDLVLPPDYPFVSAPTATMVSEPGVFHPNWWPRKNWCYGTWDGLEGLGYYVVRMIRTLQYDPVITNHKSVANRAADEWSLSHSDEGLFPCDTQLLPDPTKSKFKIQTPVKRKFQILS